MPEVFKTRVESSQEPEIALQGPKPLPGDKLAGNETKATDGSNSEHEKLDIWEGLYNREYAQDYFGIRIIADTFPINTQWKFIDKFIKGEIETNKYEKSIKNYEKILQEIEEEAGTANLEVFTRLKRLSQYIKVIKKYREIQEKKESFKTLLK
jgi:hypothetical protein